MLTLHKTNDSQLIAELVKGRKRTPVYWYPTVNESLMNSVEDLHAFNNGYFRDRFELSKEQAAEIFTSFQVFHLFSSRFSLFEPKCLNISLFEPKCLNVNHYDIMTLYYTIVKYIQLQIDHSLCPD